jgi:hypothetical protein
VSGLTEFLSARIDEDEAVARAAAKRPIVSRGQWGGEPRAQPRVDSIGVVWYRHDDGWSGSDSATFREGDAHFARFDPARVLAECEAKRRIVAEHGPREVASLDRETWAQTFTVCRRCRNGERQVVAPCPTLRLLALPYAEHPDYREGWRP